MAFVTWPKAIVSTGSLQKIHSQKLIVQMPIIKGKFRAKVSEVLDFLHEVNGDKFKQSDDEITKRLDCIVSVSDSLVTKV